MKHQLPDMREAFETRGVLVGHKIYLLGRGKHKSYTQLECYDLSEGTMQAEGHLLYEMERPAITQDGKVTFLYEDGIIQTYNVQTGERYAYKIDLNIKDVEMLCTDGKLYLLGGYDAEDSDTSPSRKLYCVEINDFNRTVLYNTK